MKRKMIRIAPVQTLVLIAVTICISAHTAAKPAPDKDKNSAARPVVARPELVPDTSGDIAFPKNATTDQKLDFLLNEVQKLRAAARRTTLIVTAELQLVDKKERDGATISVSGGRLTKALDCISDDSGLCIFILDPVQEGDPDYSITISAPRFQAASQNIRLAPGAVALTPMRVELTPKELEKRIKPPMD